MTDSLVKAYSEKHKIRTERINLEAEYMKAGRQLETRSNSIAKLANEMVRIEQHLSGVSAVLEVARKREKTAIINVTNLEQSQKAPK